MKKMTLTAIATALFSTSALATNPATKMDDAWISVDGTVESVSRDAFVLDYGSGTIIVEMDDGDRDADGYQLVKDDKVRVSGVIDHDFFEAKTIEASSVYVENLGTYFFASAADEEDVLITYTVPVVVSETIVRGTVSEVSEEEFTVNTGVQSIRVDVEEMAYNPLDNKGYQKINEGDRVSVSGDMENEFFDEKELMAKSIVTLSS